MIDDSVNQHYELKPCRAAAAAAALQDAGLSIHVIKPLNVS